MQNNGLLKTHTQKAHRLTEKGNVIESSAGIAIFTAEALGVKEKVSESFFTNVKCVTIKLSTKQILADICKTSAMD